MHEINLLCQTKDQFPVYIIKLMGITQNGTQFHHQMETAQSTVTVPEEDRREFKERERPGVR